MVQSETETGPARICGLQREQLFDEMNLIQQPACTMRVLSVLSILAATGLAAVAQTNTTEYPAPGAGLESAATASTTPTDRAAKVREVTLQDCLQLALQHNLDLQIDRYNPQIALFALNAAYGGYDPTLFLSGEHDHSETGTRYTSNGGLVAGSKTDANNFSGNLGGMLPWGTTYTLQGNAIDTYGSFTTGPAGEFNNSSASAGIQLAQPLLKNFWIDSTRLNVKVAKNRLKYSELGLQSQIMQIATAVETAYYDLIYARENVLVQQKAVELAERLVMENRKRLEVGTLAPLDLQSAEAQAATSKASLIAARSQLGTQERALKLLISDQFRLWQPISLVPSGTLNAPRQVFDLQESWTKGLTQRPDLLQAKLDVEQAGIQLKYDRNQLFPQLDAFGSYGYNGTGLEFSDSLYDVQQRNQPFYTYGGRLTFPLSNTSARNAYKSSKATQQQVVLSLKRLEQNIMVTIDNDIQTIQANYDQVEATRAARQYAEAALAAEQLKLENGKSTTYTVLQMQRDLTSARGNEIQALDVYNRSLSQLSLDEGSTLQRLNINLETK
jgi:outer membrane protein